MKQEPLGILVKKLSYTLAKCANNEVRKEGLTFTQMSLLVFIDRSEGKSVSMKNIQNRYGVSQPTVVGIVHRLAQKEMIVLKQDPQNRRAKRIWLSELGKEKCAIAYRHMEEMETALVSRMDEEEQQTFRRLLTKAITTVTEEEQ